MDGHDVVYVRAGQGADLLETRGWDDLASGVIEASYSWSSSFSDAAIWRSSNSVKCRPPARMRAPNMSLSTGFSPKPLGMICASAAPRRTAVRAGWWFE